MGLHAKMPRSVVPYIVQEPCYIYIKYSIMFLKTITYQSFDDLFITYLAYIYAWACVFTCADVYALARGVIGLLHMFMNFFCDGLHYEISKSRCLNSLAIQIRFKESQLERTSCNSSCLVIGFVREE